MFVKVIARQSTDIFSETQFGIKSEFPTEDLSIFISNLCTGIYKQSCLIISL